MNGRTGVVKKQYVQVISSARRFVDEGDSGGRNSRDDTVSSLSDHVLYLYAHSPSQLYTNER